MTLKVQKTLLFAVYLLVQDEVHIIVDSTIRSHVPNGASIFVSVLSMERLFFGGLGSIFFYGRVRVSDERDGDEF